MAKLKKIIELYADASALDNHKEKKLHQSFGSYVIIEKGKTIEENVINLGEIADNTSAEFRNVEIAIERVKNICRGINIHKVHLIIYTDSQSISRMLNSWGNPQTEKISLIFERVNVLRSSFGKCDVYWKDRNSNLAGKLLERYLKNRKQNAGNNENVAAITLKDKCTMNGGER